MTSLASKNTIKTKLNKVKRDLKINSNKAKYWGFLVNNGQIYARNKRNFKSRRLCIGPEFKLTGPLELITTPFGWVQGYSVRLDFLRSGQFMVIEYSGLAAKTIAHEFYRHSLVAGSHDHLQALTCYLANAIDRLMAQHQKRLSLYGLPVKQSR